MYEKILVPLDGSKESECIIDHVAMLVKACNIPKVVLLRVIEPFSPAAASYLGGDKVREAEKKGVAEAEEYLSYAAEPLRTFCGGVQTVVLKGRAADTILDYAEKNGIDLIAMSTHGMSGLTRWTVGSVTQKVQGHSNIAVLTVRPTSCRP